MLEDTFTIGKTEITVRRATGLDEINRDVMYNKIIRAISKRHEDDGPDVIQALMDKAFDYTTYCSVTKMDGTVNGWKPSKASDSADSLYECFMTFMGFTRSLREPIIDRVIKINMPMNDPELVPPELLRPEERADPKPEPPEGGKTKK